MRPAGIRKILRRAAAAAIAVLLLAALWSVPSLADEKCSITVTVPELEKEVGDAIKANVVFDVYKIVPTIQMTGYDAYIFDEKAWVYANVRDYYYANVKDKDDATADTIDEMTQLAANAVMNAKPDETGKAVASPVSTEMGLYLIALHSKTETEGYWRRESTTNRVYTYAQIGSREYVFAPILVSVPNRGASVLGTESVGSDRTKAEYDVSAGNTANNDAKWDFDIEIAAKVGLGQFTTVSIRKTMDVYDDIANTEPGGFAADTDKDGHSTLPGWVVPGQDIGFTFEVSAWYPAKNGKEIYNDVVAMEFSVNDFLTGKSKIISDASGNPIEFPVDTLVKVTEIYSGATYVVDPKTDAEQSITLTEDASENVLDFENTYNPTRRSGEITVNGVYNDEKTGWTIRPQAD